MWLIIRNNRDHLNPVKRKPGLFVRRTGCAIFELYDRVSKVTEDVIRTLYIPDKLKDWEDLNSFPAYMKSSHQKLLNSFCIVESCGFCYIV